MTGTLHADEDLVGARICAVSGRHVARKERTAVLCLVCVAGRPG